MKQFNGVLNEPLALTRTSTNELNERDLHDQLVCRCGALYASFSVIPNSEDWANCVNRLFFAMSELYAPGLVRTPFNQSWALPTESAWNLLTGMARSHISGFQFKSFATQAIYGKHGLLIAAAINIIQQIARKGGVSLSKEAIISGSSRSRDIRQKGDFLNQLPEELRIKATQLFNQLFEAFPTLTWDAFTHLASNADSKDLLLVAHEQSNFAQEWTDCLLQKLPDTPYGKSSIIYWYNQLGSVTHDLHANAVIGANISGREPQTEAIEKLDNLVRDYSLKNKESKIPKGEEYHEYYFQDGRLISTTKRVVE